MTSDEVARHFPLVRLIVGRMRRQGQLSPRLELDDVENVARLAVWEALRRFDPERGKQSTYVSRYVWGYVMRYQRNLTRSTGWHRDLGQLATVVSLDAPDDSGRTLLDVMAEQPADDAHARYVELLHAAAELDGRERVIARHLLADRSIDEAAHELGLSHDRTGRLATSVRRALAKACA